MLFHVTFNGTELLPLIAFQRENRFKVYFPASISILCDFKKIISSFTFEFPWWKMEIKALPLFPVECLLKLVDFD